MCSLNASAGRGFATLCLCRSYSSFTTSYSTAAAAAAAVVVIAVVVVVIIIIILILILLVATLISLSRLMDLVFLLSYHGLFRPLSTCSNRARDFLSICP